MSRSVPSVRDGKNGRSHVEPKMLDLLVCPQTRGPLVYDKDAQELLSHKARLAYPVRDGVPMLVVSQARVIEDD